MRARLIGERLMLNGDRTTMSVGRAAEMGRCLPFASLLQSAIDLGPRRTETGQQETFDTGGGIADNFESQLLQLAERGNDDRRH